MDYRRDIDGMRALAVLAVVACHARVPGMAGGFVGVDVFFVISGYLICGILVRELESGTFSLADFYERRVRRILPPLFLVIAACLAIGWFFLPPPAYLALAQSAIAATLFWSNVYFRQATSDYFAPAAEFEPLLHTWSLSVEEQFYLVVPLALWLAWRIDRRALLPGIALATLASFAWSLRMVEATPAGAFFLIQSRAWELGVGALLALAAGRLPQPRWLAEPGGVLGLAAIGFAIVTYDSATPFPGLAALAPVLGTALLVWTGERRQTLVAHLLAAGPLVWIGLVSYALYLWHWPALVLARHLYVSTDIPAHATAIALAVAVLLAWASTRAVEQPLRRRGNQAIIGRRAIFAASALAATMLVVVASLIVRHEGAWSRAPDLRRIVAAATGRTALEEHCRNSWRERGEPCQFGARRDVPQVLLWGDSHAASLLPGLDAVLRQRGLAGVATVTTGCPPIPGHVRAKHGADLDCSAANAAVLAWLENNPQAARTVVLSARWITHVTQANAPGEGAVHDPLVDAATGRPIPRDRAPAAIEAALKALVEHLVASGRRVVIVQGIAEMGQDVPAHYLSSRFGGLVPFAPKPLAQVLAREGPARAMIARLVAMDGVVAVDPVAAMCAESCPRIQNGHLLYRDGNHLSTYASRAYVPRMFAGVEL